MGLYAVYCGIVLVFCAYFIDDSATIALVPEYSYKNCAIILMHPALITRLTYSVCVYSTPVEAEYVIM